MLLSCYMAGASWNCCRLGTGSVYTVQLCNIYSATIRSHIRRMYLCLALNCHLHIWQEDLDLLRATAVTQAVERIPKMRVSTESWPWRRKFARCSCRDSNPGPSDHESAVLTLSCPRFSCVHLCRSACEHKSMFMYPATHSNFEDGRLSRRESIEKGTLGVMARVASHEGCPCSFPKTRYSFYVCSVYTCNVCITPEESCGS